MGSGLLTSKWEVAKWEAGSVADVHMPTSPGRQTPFRKFTKSLPQSGTMGLWHEAPCSLSDVGH